MNKLLQLLHNRINETSLEEVAATLSITPEALHEIISNTNQPNILEEFQKHVKWANNRIQFLQNNNLTLLEIISLNLQGGNDPGTSIISNDVSSQENIDPEFLESILNSPEFNNDNTYSSQIIPDGVMENLDKVLEESKEFTSKTAGEVYVKDQISQVKQIRTTSIWRTIAAAAIILFVTTCSILIWERIPGESPVAQNGRSAIKNIELPELHFIVKKRLKRTLKSSKQSKPVIASNQSPRFKQQPNANQAFNRRYAKKVDLMAKEFKRNRLFEQVLASKASRDDSLIIESVITLPENGSKIKSSHSFKIALNFALLGKKGFDSKLPVTLNIFSNEGTRQKSYSIKAPLPGEGDVVLKRYLLKNSQSKTLPAGIYYFELLQESEDGNEKSIYTGHFYHMPMLWLR